MMLRIRAGPEWHKTAEQYPSFRSPIGDLKLFQRDDKDKNNAEGEESVAENLHHGMNLGKTEGQSNTKDSLRAH